MLLTNSVLPCKPAREARAYRMLTPREGHRTRGRTIPVEALPLAPPLEKESVRRVRSWRTEKERLVLF